MDKFTEEQIRDALKRFEFEKVGVFRDSEITAFIAELQCPKNQFKEGQVVWSDALRCYECWPNSLPPKNARCRPLTLTEHGPEVRALREAADKVYRHLDSGGKLDSNTGLYDLLRDVLNAFDEVIKDD